MRGLSSKIAVSVNEDARGMFHVKHPPMGRYTWIAVIAA